MVGISGVVPDGVPAAFLTSQDGTAVRADVADNGYAFLVKPDLRPEQRYVVWTGSDGTPHVQPVVTFGVMRARTCATTAKLTQAMPRVSPDGLFGCAAPTAVNPKLVIPSRRPSRAERRRQVARMLYVVRCLPAGPFTPGVVVGDRPLPVPPVAVLPARPVAPPVAPAPRRKHR